MATTVSLNSDDTVYCTTFYGGPERGRCYSLTVVRGGVKLTNEFSEKELFELLDSEPGMTWMQDDGVRPEFFGR